MNEVVTQTETCQRASCEHDDKAKTKDIPPKRGSDDRAIEVSESRMSAEVEICETNDEWTGMNESTGKVMTQTKIEASERMKYEQESDDRVKCEDETDDKVAVATKEESSRNADKEESKGVLSHERV